MGMTSYACIDCLTRPASDAISYAIEGCFHEKKALRLADAASVRSHTETGLPIFGHVLVDTIRHDLPRDDMAGMATQRARIQGDAMS